ncbi:Heme oxygenase [Oryzisolibacter propanilivorax]|uniref:Heme oxygenase n=1 Tax=Oryzisolibacter propanilivorax TaxID=1527607 RepID=A0A1G9RC10_9BURK|nr:Heme oxygenase [Oryzisolibacter propanilivorax]
MPRRPCRAPRGPHPSPHTVLLAPPHSPAPATAQIAPLDALARLRAATRAVHEQLDRQLPIAQPGAGLEAYRIHASALLPWLTALAPELQGLAARVPGLVLEPQLQLQRLHADLHDLGLAPHDLAAAAAVAAVQQLLQAHAGAHQDAVRWGLAYVVEGSQLGGQVLHRQLAPRAGTHPLRYLQGSGAGTGARWRAFVALLQQHVQTPADVAAACAGALAAFAALQACFDAQGSPA